MEWLNKWLNKSQYINVLEYYATVHNYVLKDLTWNISHYVKKARYDTVYI